MRSGSSGASGASGSTGASGASGFTRSSLILALAVTIGWFPIVTADSQQTPVRDTRATPAPKAPSGTGVLSGTVTSVNGGAIRFAYVVLIGTTTGIVKVTATDADGRFTFSNLPVDRFSVGASKAPYLGTVAGSKRPGRSGTPIAIADGQKVTNLAIQMSMGAAIGGTLINDRGEPAVGSLVGLLQWQVQGLERRLLPVGNVLSTDDQGRYRFHSLMPGEYIVTAMGFGPNPSAQRQSAADVDRVLSGGTPSTQPPAPVPPVRNAPVYFPGTTRMTDAAPVVVGIGEDRSGVDFRLETVAMSRVEGIVTSADGQPLSNVRVQLDTASGSVLGNSAQVAATPDGRFVFPAVQPGSYIASVNMQNAFARTLVEVSGADVFGVQLTIRPPLTINGRLVFDGQSPPSTAGRRIQIRPMTNLAVNSYPTGVVTSPSGGFSVSNLFPARYVFGGSLALGPTADAMTWNLQSVLVDGREYVDLPVDIGEVAPKEIVITYTDRFQELSGKLQSQSGAPVSDYSILIFPEDKSYWFQGTRRIVVARPGTDGRFVLSGRGPTTLPPGKYLLAAVTDIGRDEQFDPAFLAQVVPAAIPLTLAPGEKKVQDLAIR